MLHAFVVMPDHFHALLTPGDETSLEKAMQMIKGGSAFRIKKELLYQWPVWHAGYHERWIRDAHEYAAKKKYVESNPVAAALCGQVQEYPYGSASGEFEMDMSQFD